MEGGPPTQRRHPGRAGHRGILPGGGVLECRGPLKSSFKPDIDMDMDSDMDIDSDMAV